MPNFDVSEHDIQDMDAEELADIEDIPVSVADARLNWVRLSLKVDGEVDAQRTYDKIVDIEDRYVGHVTGALYNDELARLVAHKEAVDGVVEQIEEDN